ncbi:MAG: threonine--tRNA ligase, partial [Candidatus Paceibacterales bacterium]
TVMSKIETIRHSLSHIMAHAVQELFPGVKFGIGPAIENGFYYDFDFIEADKRRLKRRITRITPEDLPKIEEKMKEIIKKNISFKKKKLSKSEINKIFKKQPYKLELIKELPKSKLTFYQSGSFIDLCQGPHVRSIKEINANSFKLIKIAGAYWRGDERNPMLTRIYGVAFKTKKELENYLRSEVEAEKRDHRKLGQKLDLFHIDERAGPGLILWHPKGAILKKTIEDYALNAYLKEGYELVNTPHIAKLNLWKTSGHTDFYKEGMYPPMHMIEIAREEKDDYQLKPMNCPAHILIYKSEVRSYRHLPIRYTELGTVYRYERSGTLHGLTRVRGLTQDDAHIWCTPEQLSKEIISALKLALRLLRDFGFKEYEIYLSTRPQKYAGTLKNWKKATNSLKYALEKAKIPYQIDPGEGVFYGPKIDIKVKDSLGRAWQLTTIQVDFNLPERFEMTFIDKRGKKQAPIMIHRALLGSLERFIGVLLEHYAGSLPVWLSPIQVWIIPVGSRHKKYAQKVKKELSSFRVEVKEENETVSKKIREGELQKIPYLLVVGDKEVKTKSVRVRKRAKGDIGIMKLKKFLEKIKIEIEKKK